VQEFYRTGNTRDKNRKIFVRLRVPSGRSGSAYRLVVNSLTTARKGKGEDGTTTTSIPGPVTLAEISRTWESQLDFKDAVNDLLIVADETKEWGSYLQYASGGNQQVLNDGELLNLVDPDTPALQSAQNKLNAIMDGTTVSGGECRTKDDDNSLVPDADSKDKCDAALGEWSDFTRPEQFAIASAAVFSIEKIGEQMYAESASTKRSDDPNASLTPEEQRAYDKRQRGEKLKEDVTVDAIRVQFAGDIYLVRNDNTCDVTNWTMDKATWCLNSLQSNDTVRNDLMPYETAVKMGEKYPGTCGREHFDYDMGMCRITGNTNPRFILHGFDDGITVPLGDCAGDLGAAIAKQEGETDEQFEGRRSEIREQRHDEWCKKLLPSFDKRSEATRHCEKHGCTYFMHDKNGTIFKKSSWTPVLGSLTSNTHAAKSYEGVDAYEANGIDRLPVGQGTPTPLCQFCEIDGLPRDYGYHFRQNCCRCGGGENRRFKSVPLYQMRNPLLKYSPPRSIEVVEYGKGYAVGDVLNLFSTAIPDATGGQVRVTRVYNVEGIPVDRADGLTCEQTCNKYGTVCVKGACDDSAASCLCGRPGDPRGVGAVVEVELAAPGREYESGAALYKSTPTGSSKGEGASFRIRQVYMDGSIAKEAPAPSDGSVRWGWMAGALLTLIIGVAVSGVAWKRGRRGYAGGVAFACAGLVGVLAYMAMDSPPVAPPIPTSEFPPKHSLKSTAACAVGETLVNGECMDADATKATTMLRKAGFLARATHSTR